MSRAYFRGSNRWRAPNDWQDPKRQSRAVRKGYWSTGKRV
ncbi:protein of unknown function [Ralstonia solanacearum CFBP2957]|nr:protein of unknown function [Ralstonia solanacearum CFBP2957]